MIQIFNNKEIPNLFKVVRLLSLFLFFLLSQSCRKGEKHFNSSEDSISSYNNLSSNSFSSKSEITPDFSQTVEDSNRINDLTKKIGEIADSLLLSLTLEERVGQCFMPAIMCDNSAVTHKLLDHFIYDLHVGGILLMKGDIASSYNIIEKTKLSPIPVFNAIDAEWGLGMRLKDAPVFPVNRDLAQRIGEQEMYEYGREIGRECKSLGINMVMGPVLDVTESTKGVIGKRSFGGDTKTVADLGVAYAKGLESFGVISVAKHFPGHGAVLSDSHVVTPVVSLSKEKLDSASLYPFKVYSEERLSGIMAGHLIVPSVDSSEKPAAVSEVILGPLLRDELDFTGLVMTDAFDMGGVAEYTPAVAIVAGADIVVAPRNIDEDMQEVIEEVKEGEIPISLIDDRCRRILFYKLMLSASVLPSASEKISIADLHEGAEKIKDMFQ